MQAGHVLPALTAPSSMTEVPLRFEKFSFGSIRIDGVTHEHDGIPLNAVPVSIGPSIGRIRSAQRLRDSYKSVQTPPANEL